jgi:hypothetical protein
MKIIKLTVSIARNGMDELLLHRFLKSERMEWKEEISL